MPMQSHAVLKAMRSAVADRYSSHMPQHPELTSLEPFRTAFKVLEAYIIGKPTDGRYVGCRKGHALVGILDEPGR